MNPWSQRKATELPSWNWSPYLWPLTGTPGSWHSFWPKATKHSRETSSCKVTYAKESKKEWWHYVKIDLVWRTDCRKPIWTFVFIDYTDWKYDLLGAGGKHNCITVSDYDTFTDMETWEWKCFLLDPTLPCLAYIFLLSEINLIPPWAHIQWLDIHQVY